MYEKIHIPRTPKSARKLLRWGKVNNLPISDDLRILAQQTDFTHQDYQVQEATQYIIDNDNRAVVMFANDDYSSRDKRLSFNNFAKQDLFPMIIIANPGDIKPWYEILQKFIEQNDERTVEIVTARPKSVVFEKDTTLRFTDSRISISGGNATKGKDVYLIDTVGEISEFISELFPATSLKSMIYDFSNISVNSDGSSLISKPKRRNRHDNFEALRLFALEIPNTVILTSYLDLFTICKSNGKEVTDVSLNTESLAIISKILYNYKMLPKIFPLEHTQINKQLNESGYKLTDDAFLAYLPLIGITIALLEDNNGTNSNDDISK